MIVNKTDNRETAKIPTPDAIRAQLERILSSVDFRASDRLKNFLRSTVQETLAGRTDRLKGYTIAVDLFGRPENFDPKLDPIVSVEAGRLRRALEHYYLSGGRNDALKIDVPRGRYIEKFAMNGAAHQGSRHLPYCRLRTGVMTPRPNTLPVVVNIDDDVSILA